MAKVNVSYNNFPSLDGTIEVKKVKLNSGDPLEEMMKAFGGGMNTDSDNPLADLLNGLSGGEMKGPGFMMGGSINGKELGEKIEQMKEVFESQGINPNNPTEDIGKLKQFFSDLEDGKLDQTLIDHGIIPAPTPGVLPLEDFLFPDTLGSIKCISRKDLYKYFKSLYGNDTRKYLSVTDGVQYFRTLDKYTENSDSLMFDDIEKLEFVCDTETYILFHTKMKDKSKFGYYIAFFISAESEEFEALIPTFGNTFKVDAEKEKDAISLLDFEADEDDLNSDIIHYSPSTVQMGINWVLYEGAKKVIMVTPHEFGPIKAEETEITKDSAWLKIGTISIDSSDTNSKASLLLQDAGLDESKGAYPLYVKFSKEVDVDILKQVGKKFLEVNWDEVPLLDEIELKYTSSGKLYFNLDIEF